MQGMFWKISSIVLLLGFILCIPLSGFAAPDTQFPYHIDKTVEKEKIYDHTFETIWKTALMLVREMGKIKVHGLQEDGMGSVKSSLKSDKSSGLIIFSLTHHGDKGIIIDDKSLFYYQVLRLKPLGEKRTQVSFHELNFYSYDQYVFLGKQNARYVDFTPGTTNILEKINSRLKEKTLETQ